MQEKARNNNISQVKNVDSLLLLVDERSKNHEFCASAYFVCAHNSRNNNIRKIKLIFQRPQTQRIPASKLIMRNVSLEGILK